ncbi:cyclic lactone autoinducer peptide [Viridibacillus sp. NPDC096237]
MKKIQRMFTEGIINLFIGVGALSVENFCLLYNFEPEIPEELKK